MAKKSTQAASETETPEANESLVNTLAQSVELASAEAELQAKLAEIRAKRTEIVNSPEYRQEREQAVAPFLENMKEALVKKTASLTGEPPAFLTGVIVKFDADDSGKRTILDLRPTFSETSVARKRAKGSGGGSAFRGAVSGFTFNVRHPDGSVTEHGSPSQAAAGFAGAVNGWRFWPGLTKEDPAGVYNKSYKGEDYVLTVTKG